MRKAAFLDRDGTLIEDIPYIREPARVRVLPGVPAGMRRLSELGFELIIVTNQSVVGRGLGTIDEVAAVNARVVSLLAQENVTIRGVLFCPHDPEAGCACRKPAPGMLLDAAAKLGVELGQSVMIGDKDIDIEAGRAAGVRWSVYVGREEMSVEYGLRARDLDHAARLIARLIGDEKS